MELKSISITNFRSITSVKRIPLGNYCVIFGKNNEGKTNVLNAINLAMSTLNLHFKESLSFSTYKAYKDHKYDFERDYPVSLQLSEPLSPTVLILQFYLNDSDIALFRTKVGLSNNGSLSIKITFDKDNKYTIKVLEKRGKGATSYSDKLDIIINFLISNIVFQYIPAVRTEEDSINILTNLVAQELLSLNDDDEYNEAMNIVRNKQTQLMTGLNEKIFDIVKVFLPDLVNTEIELNDTNRRVYRRDFNFYVNDGTRTNISYKGEGIKSLITLALLNSSSRKNISRIIAIEEPESHLHPEAIHQINNVIQQISETSQVIITTHNGVFANRLNISSNILIDNGLGKKANSLNEIRELLGIRLSDNLVAAEVMVIVEGEDDCISFKNILMKISTKIKNAIKNKKLDFTDLGGATNLKYKCSLYSSLMCKYYAIVDGDKCGISAYEETVQKGLIKYNGAVLYAYGDKKESEFEDFLKKELYKDIISSDYGVNIEVADFKGCKSKWSDRLKKTFIRQMKPFNDQIEAEIKRKIADKICVSELSDIFPENYLESMKLLASQIEAML